MNLLIPIFEVLGIALNLYSWAVIIYTIMSMLVSFNVINTYNQFVRFVMRALGQLVEPALRPIRRFMPIFGGLDLSPVVLLLAIYFVQRLLVQIAIALSR